MRCGLYLIMQSDTVFTMNSRKLVYEKIRRKKVDAYIEKKVKS